MKIGFYIHHSTIKAGGIFTYSIGILRLLLNSNEIDKICLIYSPEIKNDILNLLKHPKVYSLEIDRRKWSIKFSLMLSYFLYDNYLLIKNYFPLTTKADFLRRFSFGINPYKSRINKEDISLLHIPVQYSPVYSLKIPVITTMHDLQEFHFPEYFSSQERLHRAINNKKSIEESSFIIVSFNHIKADILKFFDIAVEKISVCPPPFSENWFTNDSYTDFIFIKKKYSLPDTFILYPAATWQHKNHTNLLDALFDLKKNGINVELICTGNKTEYFENFLSQKINKLNLQNEVKFLGIIPESDLISLYKLTSLVVIPTKYEAGSGPLYEAMRYTAPVICSNITSLPETMNNNEFTFNPDNPGEISELIRKGITDKAFRERNILNSQKRIEYFKKMNFEKSFTDLYREIISGKVKN
jgi:glycosyltransferase involved in cell wall biosynthesis